MDMITAADVDAVEAVVEICGDEDNATTPVIGGAEMEDAVNEEILNAQLVSRLARLRDAAWEAVVFKEFAKLEIHRQVFGKDQTNRSSSGRDRHGAFDG